MILCFDCAMDVGRDCSKITRLKNENRIRKITRNTTETVKGWKRVEIEGRTMDGRTMSVKGTLKLNSEISTGSRGS